MERRRGERKRQGKRMLGSGGPRVKGTGSRVCHIEEKKINPIEKKALALQHPGHSTIHPRLPSPSPHTKIHTMLLKF